MPIAASSVGKSRGIAWRSWNVLNASKISRATRSASAATGWRSLMVVCDMPRERTRRARDVSFPDQGELARYDAAASAKGGLREEEAVRLGAVHRAGGHAVHAAAELAEYALLDDPVR